MRNFTTREQQVVDLILKEYSSARIAKELEISERTVETYRKNIYSKVGVSNVVGLVKHIMQRKS